MNQTADTPANRLEPEDVRQQLAGKHACPFCGVIRADPQQPCARCTMEDSAATRGATRQRIGPWFVLQARNPSAPGMKFATMLQLVRKGHVTPRSIVRGPTSQQLWTFAAKLRGLSREFGLCCHCGESVEPTSMTCGQCGYSQDLPSNPDTLYEPPEAVPPDIMEGTKPARDTGMDGGTSLDLQASDLPISAAIPAPLAATPPVNPAPLSPAPIPLSPVEPAARPVPRPTKPATSPNAPPSNLARRPERPAPLPVAPPNNEGILTARELAAAFQLDFQPKGEKKLAGKKVFKAAGAAAGPIAPAAPKRKGSLLRTIVVLILIMLASATITLLLRPDWREIVFKAASDKYASLQQSLEQPGKSNAAPTSPKPTPQAKPSAPAPAAQPKPSAPANVTPAPQPSNPTPPTPQVVEKKPEPAPQPEVAPQVAVAPKPQDLPPAPAPQPKPEPKPIPAPPTPPVPNPTPTPPTPTVSVPTDNTDIDSLTIDQAIDKASQWRNQAMDATAKGDWAGAITLYERIQKLPRDAWPTDLAVKLDIARQHAGQ